MLEADLVIGRDGERSLSRNALIGRPDPPKHSGDIVFRTAVPISRQCGREELQELLDPPSVHFWLGPNAHALSYTLKEAGLLNVVLVCPDYSDSQVSLGPQAADIAEVKKVVEDWYPRFKTLLGPAPGATKWILVKCNDVSSWTHPEGRFALLGSSAHAMLPYM